MADAVPFGKYRGQPVAVMSAETGRLERSGRTMTIPEVPAAIT
jgi:hypothetical protein